MGLILDSSVLIAAERQDKTVYQVLSDLCRTQNDIEVGISVVTIAELAHGVARAGTPQRKEQRLRFVHQLATAIPIYDVTAPTAFQAALIDRELQTKGVRVPLADLLIGVTALELEFGVGTSNLRHFREIPGLVVTQI
jgi:tRNA(fMet)-specific endonuclease VapC